MRRWNTYQHVNQNGTVRNHFNSNEESPDSLSPEIVMGEIWVQDDTTQVEIIELDSNDAEITPAQKRAQDNSFGQYWQYVDKDRFSMPEPEVYKMNKKAREKRRMFQRLDRSNDENSSEILENEFAEVVNDIVYSSFYGSINDVSDKKKNHNANCFTIINKPFNSDTSSDEIEFIDRTDTPDHMNGDTPYDSEIITFDKDEDTNKRTIWIYSFRNQRLLSENNFELINIPSQDSTSSTSCSLDNFSEEVNVSKTTSRVASPIPATYVPRLNLSAATTLPTVTEITEPSRNLSDETPKSVKSFPTTNRYKSNNWCDEKITTNGFHLNNIDKHDKSSNTDVINWMSLSPRERRRRSRHTKSSPTYQFRLPALVEIPSTEPISNDSVRENARPIQTTADINFSEEKPEKMVTASPTNLPHSDNRDQIVVTDVDYEDGDSGKKSLQKPHINISPSRPKGAFITDPIENLEGNWIHEDKVQKSIDTVSVTSGSGMQESVTIHSVRDTADSASKRLWARNMSLLKPVAWAEFLPITDSVPSLHLSIESDSDKQSWMKRLVTKCFRCFK